MSAHGGSRRRRHHEDHDEHPSEAWLIALADMMTLLMVTFLMMFAISSLDLKKFQTFKEAFAEGTGTSLPSLPGEGVPAVGPVVDDPRVPTGDAAAAGTGAGTVLDAEALEELRKKVQAQLDKAGLADRIQAKTDRRGLVLYVTSGVLFASGEADVTATGRTLLDGLGPVLRSVGNDLVVEGHTDSRPVRGGQFGSNWELSAMRATAVARQLMDVGEIASERVSIAGYADTRPRRNLPGEAAFAVNRRVEIVIEAPTALVTAAAGAVAPVAPVAPPAPAEEEADEEDSGH